GQAAFPDRNALTTACRNSRSFLLTFALLAPWISAGEPPSCSTREVILVDRPSKGKRAKPTPAQKPPQLAEYTAKRVFAATPEPAPAPLEQRSGPLLFVIQQHSAPALHYDLRVPR